MSPTESLKSDIQDNQHNVAPKFTLIVPFDASNVTIARLVIAGIANHAAMSFDEIEDIKMALGEAFNFFLSHSDSQRSGSIRIDSLIHDKKLEIKVSAKEIFLQDQWEQECKMGDLRQAPTKAISSLAILKHLVDDVFYHDTKEGSELTFVKSIA